MSSGGSKNTGKGKAATTSAQAQAQAASTKAEIQTAPAQIKFGNYFEFYYNHYFK